MKQILLILQCLYTISLNIVTNILIHLVVYGVFRRDEIANDADVSNDDNSTKQVLLVIRKTVEKKNGVKIAVPLKYLSNFWRSLEMSLINCKAELALTWIQKCMLTVANTATFKITDAKLYVPIVTSSAENYQNYWVMDLVGLFIGTNTK